MRTLGIDFGLKRVGLALSDPRGALAFPYRTITRTTREALFTELLEIIAREDVQAVIVGLPLTLDGGESTTTRQARNFAASLARRTPLPVALVDERLSSAAADDDLDQAGLRDHARRKAARDQQAAVRILQSFIDHAGVRP